MKYIYVPMAEWREKACGRKYVIAFNSRREERRYARKSYRAKLNWNRRHGGPPGARVGG